MKKFLILFVGLFCFSGWLYAWSLFGGKSPSEIRDCKERYVRESIRICFEEEKRKLLKMSDEELISQYGDYRSALHFHYKFCSDYYQKAVNTFNVC